MRKVDFLIIGQGLAGSVLAYQLLQRNKTIAIVDQGSGNTASRQATGLINPITGRRFVKSWMIDELLPFAQNFYQHTAQALNVDFYQENQQYKVLQNLEQLNDFNVRMHDDAYKEYLSIPTEKPSSAVIEEYSGAVIQPLIQVNIPLMQDAFLSLFREKGLLMEELMDYQKLEQEKNGYHYKEVIADKVVFAEGYKLKDNPFFAELPIRFAKGEALIIKSADLDLNVVLNSKINITPIGHQLFYVGATYDWSNCEQTPSTEKKNYILTNLEKSVDCNFELVSHKVGIRPTVVDRRPLIGEHKKYKGMYVFNGMGTKGLSLAPYFAASLIDHILEGKILLKEVDISRFL